MNITFNYNSFANQAKCNISKYYKSQDRFAREIGYSRKQVSYLLNNIETIRLDTIILFANNLKMDLSKYYVQA